MSRERHRLGFKIATAAPQKLAVVDVYPSLDRSGETGLDDSDFPGSCPPVLPCTKLWLIEQNRLATGQVLLALQGLPTRNLNLQGISQAAMSDLAGNAFCGGSFATVFIAMLAELPLGELSSADSSDGDDGMNLSFLDEFMDRSHVA